MVCNVTGHHYILAKRISGQYTLAVLMHERHEMIDQGPQFDRFCLYRFCLYRAPFPLANAFATLFTSSFLSLAADPKPARTVPFRLVFPTRPGRRCPSRRKKVLLLLHAGESVQ